MINVSAKMDTLVLIINVQNVQPRQNMITFLKNVLTFVKKILYFPMVAVNVEKGITCMLANVLLVKLIKCSTLHGAVEKIAELI